MEIMVQLLGHDKDYVEELLHLWVPCFGIMEDFTSKVDMLLNMT